MATIAPSNRESKKEVVGRMQARDQNGAERWIEEVIPYSRTKDEQGNWSEWVQGPKQFWEGNIICVRRSETEFEPVMTEDVLTLVKP
jgi:hypothetical protein